MWGEYLACMHDMHPEMPTLDVVHAVCAQYEDKVAFTFCGAAVNAELAADSFKQCFDYAWHLAGQLEQGLSLGSYLAGFATGLMEKSSKDEARRKRDRCAAKAARAQDRMRRMEEALRKAEAGAYP